MSDLKPVRAWCPLNDDRTAMDYDCCESTRERAEVYNCGVVEVTIAPHPEYVAVRRDVLEAARRHIKHNAAPPPGHVCCGPSNCDAGCQDHARDTELLEQLKEALNER